MKKKEWKALSRKYFRMFEYVHSQYITLKVQYSELAKERNGLKALLASEEQFARNLSHIGLIRRDKLDEAEKVIMDYAKHYGKSLLENKRLKNLLSQHGIEH